MQQIFSHLAIAQIWFKISSCNFQYLFIGKLCKFDKKKLAVTYLACQPRPILAKTLDASRNHILLRHFKKKKKWQGSGPIGVTSWKDFSISFKKWCFEIFRTSAESRASDPWLNHPWLPCLRDPCVWCVRSFCHHYTSQSCTLLFCQIWQEFLLLHIFSIFRIFLPTRIPQVLLFHALITWEHIFHIINRG